MGGGVCVYAKRCFFVELEVLLSGFEVSLEAGVIQCALYKVIQCAKYYISFGRIWGSHMSCEACVRNLGGWELSELYSKCSRMGWMCQWWRVWFDVRILVLWCGSTCGILVLGEHGVRM